MRKKPTRLKIIQGTFQRERQIEGEIEPELIPPDEPHNLSAEASAEWKRLSQELQALGLLSRIDRAAFAAYCEAWADFVDASIKCTAEDGSDRKILLIKGIPVMNPYWEIKTKSMLIMLKFIQEFGLSPASRTRVSGNTLRDDDDATTAMEKRAVNRSRWKGFG